MRVFFSLIFITLISACSSNRFVAKQVTSTSDSLKYHTGFVLYDPAKKKNLVSVQANKYFTPASNTKIFTLFTGLKLLGDSVPALRWVSKNDSLFFWGSGDPSLLYSVIYQNNRTLNFLRERPEKLYYSSGNFHDNSYGPGWSWADYQDYYQAERNALPVYGNLITIGADQIQPERFQTLGTRFTMGASVARDRYSNLFAYNVTQLNAQPEVLPFITGDSLVVQLLRDTLSREVQLTQVALPKNAQTFFSIKTDSLYKVMMQASDNFIAEQILLMAAQTLTDTLRADIAIDHITQKHFSDSPDPLLWFDGSGLSRYNQFTPRTIVALWEKIYAIVPQERLFKLLVTNGQAGTLRSLLPDMPTFIYGKTGSLANNYCLSGYLITRKNRLLIFSSMNTGITSPSSAVRKNLSKTLRYIYEHY